jgi:hypothetical protein
LTGGEFVRKTWLPAEIKHRDPTWVRVIAPTAARHAMADVVAALRAFADRLEAEMGSRRPDPTPHRQAWLCTELL